MYSSNQKPSEGNILSDTKYVSGTNFVHKETNSNNDPHIYLTNNKKMILSSIEDIGYDKNYYWKGCDVSL